MQIDTSKWKNEDLVKVFLEYIRNTPIQELRKSYKNDILDESETMKKGEFHILYSYNDDGDYITFLVMFVDEKDKINLSVRVGFNNLILDVELNKKNNGIYINVGKSPDITSSDIIAVVRIVKEI